MIALSSGEAEYYGLVGATSQMLSLQSILQDGGWKFKAVCGWTPQLALLLAADEGSVE